MKVARLLPLFVATMAVCWAIAPSVETLLQSNSVAVVVAAAIGLALAAKDASDAAHELRRTS